MEQCMCDRCYPSWLWVSEWMTSSSSLTPSVRPDRTRGSRSRWGGPPHTLTAPHPHQQPSAPTLPSYLLHGVECVKACLCLWCSIKRPARRTPLSKQCSVLNLFLFIFCWCCWDFSAFSRSIYKMQSDWMMASLPDLQDFYKIQLEPQTVHDFMMNLWCTPCRTRYIHCLHRDSNYFPSALDQRPWWSFGFI